MKRDEIDKRDEIAAHLPLTPALFQVLLALADGDKHGYAILKEVGERTRGRVRPSTGTLYGIIKRLLHDELIAEQSRRPSRDDERRRYYRLTPLGRNVASAEAERMEEMIATARLKKLIRAPQTEGSVG